MSVEQQIRVLDEGALEADQFEVTGPVRATFATTSFAGPAQLTYRDAEFTLSFSGPEITRTPTPVGELVSVLLDSVVDRQVRMFTLLVPRVRLRRGEEVGFTTVGIATTDRARAFVPPFGPVGALHGYQTYQLSGVARVLDF
jgi:hypothetical protein